MYLQNPNNVSHVTKDISWTSDISSVFSHRAPQHILSNFRRLALIEEVVDNQNAVQYIL